MVIDIWEEIELMEKRQPEKERELEKLNTQKREKEIEIEKVEPSL